MLSLLSFSAMLRNMATARERAHQEVRAEIVAAGRRQLAEVGGAGLSLRAVSREVGMVSSAVYRYFPRRDDLLTALIVEAYDALATAADTAERRTARDDPGARWLAVTRAVRRWARRNRHEWELLFGTPVPGYAAPAATVDPALVVPLAMVSIAAAVPPPADDPAWPTPSKGVSRDLAAMARQIAPGMGEQQLTRGVMAWTALVGAVSFELFGHLHNGIHDVDGWFDQQMRLLARGLGIAA
jgi:AcrR family transcriptional regulator